jgi:hypothetical protein
MKPLKPVKKRNKTIIFTLYFAVEKLYAVAASSAWRVIPLTPDDL